MNNKYTRKQILEAIQHWRRELVKMNEDIDGDGPIAGYLVVETEGPDEGWDKDWLKGERESNIIGLYRTEADAKAVAENTVFDWLDRMAIHDQVIDCGYWQDYVDNEIYMNPQKQQDFRDKGKSRQIFIQWLVDKIRSGFTWSAKRDGTVELRYKNPFDDDDFHEYFVEIRPMRFSNPPAAKQFVQQIQSSIPAQITNQAVDQALQTAQS